MNTDNDVTRAIRWLWVVASLVGLVWLWFAVDSVSMLVKLFVVVAAWAIWIGVISVAVTILALLLGMVGVVVQPLRRR